jgi:hypothetical protein
MKLVVTLLIVELNRYAEVPLQSHAQRVGMGALFRNLTAD